MIKRILLLWLLTLTVFFLPKGSATAQANLLSGQKHNYSVFVKSNRETFVFARLALINPEESPITKSSFTLVDAKASEMSIYQVVLPQECKRYSYRTNEPTCVHYEDPVYTQDNRYYSSPYEEGKEIEYFKVAYQEANGKYTFDLPKPVEGYKSTALIVIYATKDYVQKDYFGRYSFEFKTLAVDQRIIKANVAITPETDYQIKNADNPPGKDNPYGVGYDGMAVGGANIETSISNPDIDELVNSIGDKGHYNKVFDNVTPNESVSTKGMFSKGRLKLYAIEYLFGLIGVIGFIALLMLLSKRYAKKTLEVNQEDGSKKNLATSYRASLFVPLFWALSFTSALLVCGLSLALMSISRSQVITAYLDDKPGLLAILLLIVAGCMYLVAFFGPAVYTAIKYKTKSALMVITLQMFWYVLVALLLSAVSM